MKKRYIFFGIFLLIFVACNANNKLDYIFSENTILKVDIPENYQVFDDDENYIYASSFIDYKNEENEVAESKFYYHRINKNSGDVLSAEFGEFSIGFLNYVHIGNRIYATVKETEENDNKISTVAVELLDDARSGANILTETSGFSQYVQMRQINDDELIFFNPVETSTGYDYELFLYRIADKKLIKIIETNYDNELVEGEVIQAFGIDETSQRIYLYVNEYGVDSVTTLLPQKTSIKIYDKKGNLMQEYILNLTKFMDLSAEFKNMTDFVTKIFVKDNVIVLETKNGRIKAFHQDKDILREIVLDGSTDKIHSMKALNNRIEDQIYILSKGREGEAINFLYCINTKNGIYQKFDLNFNYDQVKILYFIPRSQDDSLLCAINIFDLTGYQSPKTLYFLVDEDKFKDNKNLISDKLLFENNNKTRDINE